MTNVNVDPPPPSQGDGGSTEPPPTPGPASPALHGGDKVYKSGPLFLSSKGIGWTSWKKRWFILTRTSLVFFRTDPNVTPQKGSEVNLTLGGIDLNSSGSVVVKEDKKLITVLFPDGRDSRDGRAFTLKAETLEDLHEWKKALEEALSNAPAASLVGQNGNLKNDQSNAVDDSSEQLKEKQSIKSLVIGRPILLALEDIDGTPSFLEKALKFLEEHGVRTEGILRQAADVDDVERRIREYEKGKGEFSAEEDAHVIGDCVKYVLRELPSSPVPASCCNALLEALRTERGMRVNAMRSAICETFPEPNRRLLQRILMMMQTVASQKAVNRMSISAVAACMAPLLLRPLLAGDCELENSADVGGDGSVQLLQAAAAANHAQAIVITLLEEYDKIFGEGSVTPEPYTDSEESGSESEEMTDDDYDDSFDDDGDDDATEDSDVDIDEDSEHELRATNTETNENDIDMKVSRSHSLGTKSTQVHDVLGGSRSLSSNSHQTSSFQHDSVQTPDIIPNQCNSDATKQPDSSELLGPDDAELSGLQKESKSSPGPVSSVRKPTVWGRTPAKKNLSMESIDLPSDDEDEIQRLESMKTDLENKIASETKTNTLLQDGLERRKQELRERRLALEKDVARLQEQLQNEIDLRTALEAGHGISQLPQFASSVTDEKTKADLKEIAQVEVDVWNLRQRADDLELQLKQQREHNSTSGYDVGNQFHQSPTHQEKLKQKHRDSVVRAISSNENLSRSKHGSYLDNPDTDKEMKQDSPPSLNKPKAAEMGTNNPCATGSKKLGPKGEGTNSTTSALSKLTNRLNFLKERRSQIATELQIMDKDRNSGQPVQNLEQGRGSEHWQSHHDHKGQSKNREMENYNLVHNPDQVSQNDGKGGMSEGLPNLERGKSESFPVEQGRSKVPPRTFSR